MLSKANVFATVIVVWLLGRKR